MVNKLLLFLFFFMVMFPQDTLAQEKSYAVLSVAFYNLENLFDTEDDPLINDEEFLPGGAKGWNDEKYQLKLGNMAKVIHELGKEHSPDGVSLLGVAEIENRRVLADLIQQEALSSQTWSIIHYDSPDGRGIDVALLYQPKYFIPLESRPVPLHLKGSDGEIRRTREILFVKGIMAGDTVAVLVNHWPSRRGGEKATRQYRMDGAAICKKLVDSIRMTSPATKAIIMGDLNDDPVSPSVKKVLAASGEKSETPQFGFYNPMYSFFKKGIGSNAYRDAWSLFDQIILSDNFVTEDSGGWMYLRAEIFRKPFLLQRTGRFRGYPFRTFAGDQFLGGYSDHLPVIVHLIKEIQ